MGSAQLLLELALVALLAATLVHAWRLERALGVLKRDRAVLEELVEGFNDSTRQAETGIERLRVAADGTGRQIARQIEQSQRLRDDLQFLTERGDKLAERLETTLRSARMFADSQILPSFAATASVAAAPAADAPDALVMQMADLPAADAMPKLRSQAERDLLRTLRGGR